MSENMKQVELARETLAIFIDNGEDMSEERHVLHYFYDGDFAGLGKALGDLGYEVRPAVENDGVVAERHDAIGEEWRTTVLPQLCELADNYGCEYDGWEAAMTRQQPVRKPGFLSKLLGKKN